MKQTAKPSGVSFYSVPERLWLGGKSVQEFTPAPFHSLPDDPLAGMVEVPQCVTRKPFYLADDMVEPEQQVGVAFPQTMRYEAPAEHERPTWRERLLRLVCYAVALWPALVAVALIWSASK